MTFNIKALCLVLAASFSAMSLAGEKTAGRPSAASLVANAAANEASAPVSEAEEASAVKRMMRAEVESVSRLPVTGLTMAKAGGMLFFMSDNGRYAIMGADIKLVDTWNAKILRDPTEAGKYASKVDIARLGVDINELNVVTIGTGGKQVVVFIDPECPYCKTMISQMPALASEYTFKVVPLPLLGEKSNAGVRALACAKNNDEAVSLLLSGKYGNIKTTETECNIFPLQKAVVVAKVLGVTAVPYTINHEHVTRRGAVKDLGSYLSKGTTGYEDAVNTNALFGGKAGSDKKSKLPAVPPQGLKPRAE